MKDIEVATVLVKCDVFVVTGSGRDTQPHDTEISQTMTTRPAMEPDHPRLRQKLHKLLDNVIDTMIVTAKKHAELVKQQEARLAVTKV